MNVVNALLCCQVYPTQFYRDLVFDEISEEARRKTALRFEAWRALGHRAATRPLCRPDIAHLLPGILPLGQEF